MKYLPLIFLALLLWLAGCGPSDCVESCTTSPGPCRYVVCMDGKMYRSCDPGDCTKNGTSDMEYLCKCDD